MEMEKEIENGPKRAQKEGGTTPKNATSGPCNNVLNTKSQNQTRVLCPCLYVCVGGCVYI